MLTGTTSSDTRAQQISSWLSWTSKISAHNLRKKTRSTIITCHGNTWFSAALGQLILLRICCRSAWYAHLCPSGLTVRPADNWIDGYAEFLQTEMNSTGFATRRDVDPMLVQCWPDVVDGGATLNQHWVNVSCLLGSCVSYVLQTRFNRIRFKTRTTPPKQWYGCQRGRFWKIGIRFISFEYVFIGNVE